MSDTIYPIGWVDPIKLYTDAIQKLLDTTAQEHHYDDIVNACGYAAAPNPFQAESQAFVSWRGNVWAACYVELAAVNEGAPRPSIDELVAMMPQFSG